jgi:pimeloyl-ACP methyl ester carboxylesterase
MPTATVDGIPTRYEVSGDGPPLLMFSPGGFDSTLENWTRHGLYPRIELMARLRERFTCIAFDRRESGRSGGRLERIRWDHWVAQGRRPARPPRHRAGAPDRRLRRLLDRGRVRGRAPRPVPTGWCSTRRPAGRATG